VIIAKMGVTRAKMGAITAKNRGDDGKNGTIRAKMG